MKYTKLFIYIFLVFATLTKTFSQDFVVKGKVIDPNGLPMTGVNVFSSTNSTKTSTDFDGSYTIKTNSKSTLTFSFIGYDNLMLSVNGRTNIDAKLRENYSGLNEVVVVGYGTQKKSVTTGAISSVKAKDLQDIPITRIEQALQGRTSGVLVTANSGQPGTSSSVRVRGITTLNNNDPLWVVDGIIIDNNGIGILNQSDIETIEVLKDAASQAIYGTRASAGVIIITTKKGKSGKITVGYNGFTGISTVARKLKLLNAEQYSTLMNEATAAAGQFPLPYAITPSGIIGVPDRNNSPNTLGKGTDWQSQIFNDALRTSHEFSLSGATEKSNFYISLGLLNQDGIIAKDISNYARKNIRINANHKVNNYLSFGETVAYSREDYANIDNNSETSGLTSLAINLDPTTPIIETDPEKLANFYTNPLVVRDDNGNPYGLSQVIQQQIFNPLAVIRTKLGNKSYADNFIGNAFVELSFNKNLKFKSNVAAKLAYYGFDRFTPRSYLNSIAIVVKNSYQTESNSNFGWSIENTLNYSKKLGNHSFDVLLGQGAYVDNIARQNGITKAGIPTDNYQEATINFSVPVTDITAYGSTNIAVKRNSLFSRLTYDYNQKYLLTGIVRRDGSSQFGGNNKYGIFPSFSLGWVVTKESFWKINNVVNFLKFRGGYGVVGNDKIESLLDRALIRSGSNYTFGNNANIIIGNSQDRPSNPDLRWEETSQANIGFDAVFFKNFTFTVDLYDKRTVGILKEIQVAGFIGATSNPFGNISSMTNKGIDVELGYAKKIGNVNMALKGNISHFKNEITSLGFNRKFDEGGETIISSLPFTRNQVGQPVGSFYGFQTQGIFQNLAEVNAYKNAAGELIQPNALPGDFRWKDNNGDGKISNLDRTFIGSPLPKFTYGFTINLDYNNFDLLIFAQGVAGNKIFQAFERYDVSKTNSQSTALGRWTGEGTSNTYPRLTLNDTNLNFSNPSNFFLQDGDYLRIKTLQLGYSMPKSFLAKASIERARLYITTENLLTFTKYNGYDPEIGGNVAGIDKGFYPQAISYMLGVNLQF